MWGKYQGIQGLQDTLRVATAVAADAQNPGSGGEPGQIILAKERLAREYGITDEAIRNYALYGDDDSIPADGKKTREDKGTVLLSWRLLGKVIIFRQTA